MSNKYRTLLEKWEEHLAEKRRIEAFFVMSGENSREMSTTYTQLGNIQKFTEWLQYMADAEDAKASDSDLGAGAVFTSVAGY